LKHRDSSIKTQPDSNFLETHSQLLIESFYRHTGRNLLLDVSSAELESQRLTSSAFAIISHGTQVPPIFNYANKIALSLFEMNWSEFTSLPSSESAEPVNQTERDRLLSDVKKQGYIDNYQGIRITASGKRFKTGDAIVWNLIDATDSYCGQAAVLYRWTYLTKPSALEIQQSLMKPSGAL
jgi:hypothetical protein